MRVKSLNLSTHDTNKHPLSITTPKGLTISYELTSSQVLMLCYQAIMATWTYYKLEPRE